MEFDYVFQNAICSWRLYRTIDRELFYDMIGTKNLHPSTIEIRERNPYHAILASILR